MATDIKGGGKDSKLTKWSQRTNYSNHDKALQRGFGKIKDYAYKLNIKEGVRKTAEELLALVEESDKLKGKSLDAKVAMILFVACRKNG